jgi:hypothetical protein
VAKVCWSPPPLETEPLPNPPHRYKDKAKNATERAEKLVSKRNQGVVSEANSKMNRVKEQMQKLCNLAEQLRATVEAVLGGVLAVEEMDPDDCRRLLQAVQAMAKQLAPFNQESADMVGVTIKLSTVRQSPLEALRRVRAQGSCRVAVRASPLVGRVSSVRVSAALTPSTLSAASAPPSHTPCGCSRHAGPTAQAGGWWQGQDPSQEQQNRLQYPHAPGPERGGRDRAAQAAQAAGEILPRPVLPYRRLRIHGDQGREVLGYRFTVQHILKLIPILYCQYLGFLMLN